MARATVSDAAERTLDAWLTGLMQGEIRIQDLPLCVSAWFHAGEAYGRAARQLEVEQLEREVNRWYYLATTTPTQRRDHIEHRLSQALEHATEEQWAHLDRELAHMAGQRQQDGTTTIEPAMNAEIEGKDGRDSGTTGTSRQAS